MPTIQEQGATDDVLGSIKVPAAYYNQIVMSAAQHHVRPELVAAALYTESNFDPNAVSPAGAIGIAQFEPGTAANLGIDPHNVDQSIDGMASLLSSYEQQFGSESLALAAYNAGPGAVQEAGNAIPNISETQNYVNKILALSNGEQPVTTVTGGSGDGTASSPGGLSAIVHVFDTIGAAAFWKRLGIGLLGAIVILIAIDQLTRGKVSGAVEKGAAKAGVASLV